MGILSYKKGIIPRLWSRFIAVEEREKLSVWERRFKQMAAITGEWIWEVDGKGYYTYCNSVVEQVLGYKADELLGKHLYDLFHPEDRERLKTLFDLMEKGDAFKDFELRRAMEGTLEAMASIVEIRDPFTAGHQQRVAKLASAIAEEKGLPKEQIEGIRVAGLVHDIGKIYVPVSILSKPGKLDEHEFEMLKAHPEVGYKILKKIKFPWPIAQIVLEHHERIDGSGYPQGLSDESILLEARILGVADVVEAMASHRPYRPALGIDKALEEISRNKGILYDPDVVNACIKLFSERGFKFE